MHGIPSSALSSVELTNSEIHPRSNACIVLQNVNSSKNGLEAKQPPIFTKLANDLSREPGCFLQVAAGILASLDVQRFEADFVLEGGSIHVDGEGYAYMPELLILIQTFFMARAEYPTTILNHPLFLTEVSVK